MDITNKTNRPISVPLPGGKKLFLGPAKTGQVNAKAAEHPPLVKLVEAGDLVGTDRESGKRADGQHPSHRRSVGC